MNNNSVLIINDVTGYGRVSSFAMFPVFAKYDLHPYVLPTAIVSNATDYGSPVILDTTEYMKSAIDTWSKHNFNFKYICTGFINSEDQVNSIISLISEQDEPFVLVDPIMADSGELYEGMYEGVIDCNRKLAAYADLFIPNLTEAELLTGKFKGRSDLDESEYEMLTAALSMLCPNNIVITGCASPDGRHFNLVYTADNEISKLYYDDIPEHFVGTGDIFSAFLLSEYIKCHSLTSAVNAAGIYVKELILDNIDNEDHYDIQIEKFMNKLNSLKYTE